MLNANNEISVKKEERKHSWSTVFAWLYLKTIGRILPKRWNRWAENILYYDKATANNEVQTDAFKTVDESAQVDLKPEVAEKESQSEIMSKDGKVQTDGVAFQDMTIQTEYVEKANKNIEVDLKPEIAEKESQSVVISKDKGVQTDGVAFQDTVMQPECVEKIDKSIEVNLKPEVAEKESEDEGIYPEASTNEDCSDIENEDELAWNNCCEMHGEDDEKLEGGQVLDTCIEVLNKQESSSENDALERGIGECKYVYEELREDIEMIGRLSVKPEEPSLRLSDEDCFDENISQVETYIKLCNKQNNLSVNDLLKKAIGKSKSVLERFERDGIGIEKLSAKFKEREEQLKSFENKAKRPSVELEKSTKINSSTTLKDLSSQLSAIEAENKRLENEVTGLRKQSQVKGNKENVQKKLTGMSNQKGVELEKNKKNAKALETALSNQKKEWEADSRKKAEEVERLETLKKKSDEELRETKRKLAEQERLVGQLQANIKKLKKESQLGEKASAVSLDNKYNEKYIKSYTDSLPLKDKVKTRYTPNSFLSCTSSTASIKLRERYSKSLA